jgi:hypothetical protein
MALADYASGGHSPLIDDCLASAPGAWIPPRPFLDAFLGDLGPVSLRGLVGFLRKRRDDNMQSNWSDCLEM